LNTEISHPKSLDHFVLLVDDLEKASATYRRLGFHVRPIARHIEIGSSNCVIHFPGTYLELIHLSGTAEVLLPYLDRYRCGEGIAHVSLTSDDLVSEHERLKSLGFNPGPITSARRKIIQPDGSEDETRSSFSYVWREAEPVNKRYLSLFYSEHLKPETIFIPAYEDHDNTAIDVTRLVYMSADPDGDIDYFSKSFDKNPDARNAAGFSMTGKRGEVTEVLRPDAAVTRYGDSLPRPGPEPLGGFAVVMHYGVRDPDRCAQTLINNDMDFHDWNGQLIVPASQACGCTLVFEQ
jgi:hypothetical protein